MTVYCRSFPEFTAPPLGPFLPMHGERCSGIDESNLTSACCKHRPSVERVVLGPVGISPRLVRELGSPGVIGDIAHFCWTGDLPFDDDPLEVIDPRFSFSCSLEDDDDVFVVKRDAFCLRDCSLAAEIKTNRDLKCLEKH